MVALSRLSLITEKGSHHVICISKIHLRRGTESTKTPQISSQTSQGINKAFSWGFLDIVGINVAINAPIRLQTLPLSQANPSHYRYSDVVNGG
jgi:hypothetical protein